MVMMMMMMMMMHSMTMMTRPPPPLTHLAAADDDDAMMVGPMIDKTFFSQLASNARTITDTNWVHYIEKCASPLFQIITAFLF